MRMRSHTPPIHSNSPSLRPHYRGNLPLCSKGKHLFKRWIKRLYLGCEVPHTVIQSIRRQWCWRPSNRLTHIRAPLHKTITVCCHLGSSTITCPHYSFRSHTNRADYGRLLKLLMPVTVFLRRTGEKNQEIYLSRIRFAMHRGCLVFSGI